MAAVTLQQTVEVKLSPALKKKLLTKLKTYEELSDQGKAIGVAKDKLRDEIERLFVEANEFETLQEGVKVGDYPVKHVSPVTKKLNKKLLVSKGFVTLAQLAECTKDTPGKPYLKITLPREQDEGESDGDE